MAHYLISFNDGDMTFPREDLPTVAEAAHKVMREAIEAGIWVFGGGFEGFEAKHVALDGTVVDGPLAQSDLHYGGFCILKLDSDEEAQKWAHRIGLSCRCAQEIRKFMDDAEQEELLKKH